MSHTYQSLKAFKSKGAADISKSGTDDQLLVTLEAASEWVEDWCRKRRFYPRLETKYFSGDGTRLYKNPALDLISITSLKQDDNADGTYNVTWLSSDYFLAPYDADPLRPDQPEPYYAIEVNTKSSGSKTAFSKGQRVYELVGEFGYCKLVEATGSIIEEGAAFTAVDTELQVDDPSPIGVGDTLVIESEYLYVTGQMVEDNKIFTVTRGANGSTAASHADGTAVSKLVYPKAIVLATWMRASQLWQRRAGGFADSVGFSETGVSVPNTGLDPDVALTLDRYKRLTAG